MAEIEIRQRLAAILAADAVGFSRLMGTDERATLAELDASRALFRRHCEEHDGRIVDMAGDSVLAVFTSAAAAVRAAIAAQAAVEQRGSGIADDRRLRYRIGVNLGEIIEKADGTIYGDGVNVAARLQSLAEPGGILLSAKVHDEVQGRIDAGFAAAGEHTVKNIARPLRAYRVLAAGEPAPERRGQREPAQARPPDKPSIAVLPFQNMSDDAEQEYFADGITEDLITDLSKVSGLIVIARNSTFAYKGRAVDLRDVARELGARHVLEGSVRKAGKRLRITAQLIDGESGTHLWAERYDRDLVDVFAIQDEVTREIVRALEVRLTSAESARVGRRGTADVDAWDLYVRGRQQLQRYTAESVAEARELFEQAIALDPGFGAAYAGIAVTIKNDLLNQRAADREAAQKRFEEYAAKAVALDPDEPTIHWARAADFVSQRRSAEAVREVRDWLRVEPSSDLAHGMLAQCLLYDEKADEAVPEIEYAMRLNPHFPDLYLHVLGHAQLLVREFEAAEDAFRRRIRRNPATDASRMLLACTLGHRGRVDEARAEWAELLRHHPGFVLAERRKGWFYSNPADEEFVIEGFRRAGLADDS